MTLRLWKLLSLALAACVLLPLASVAEVYKCGERWTTTPCSADSKPVQNLAKISKVEAPNEIEAEPIPATATTARARLARPTKEDESCGNREQGKDVRMVGLRLIKRDSENGVTSYYAKGAVKNTSNDTLASPLRMRVVSSNEAAAASETTIAETLPAGVSTHYSVLLGQYVGVEQAPTAFEVQLVSNDIKECKSWRLASGTARASYSKTSTGALSQTDSGPSQREEARRELRELESAMRRLKRQYWSPDSRTGDLFQRDKSNILGPLGQLCRRTAYDDMDSIHKRCIDVHREIELLR